MTEQTFRNWVYSVDEDNIVWLGIDREGASANSLNADVLNEFESAIDMISKQNPKGVILHSLKKSGFIAGADITQFSDIKTPEQAFQLMRHAQTLFSSFESLNCPTVALIDGFCLGGGLELALACDYLVAHNSVKTKLGFPEVKLGIHPGWGGTVRAVRKIGPMQAMPLMLTGRSLSARAAKKIGLIEAAVPERNLLRAAVWYINNKPTKRIMSKSARFLNSSLMRPLIGKMMYRQLAKKKVLKEHYPAPFAMIYRWIKDGAVGEKSYINEAQSIAECMLTPTSRCLVSDFFLQEKLKGISKQSPFVGKRVHVVGGGTMGGDIAAWCALRGFTVTLQDRAPEYLSATMKRAAKLFKKKLKKPYLAQQAMDRLIPDFNGDGIARADVIIEAIFENLKAKQDLFQALEEQAKPEAILATNTSSIPLDEINQVLRQPERLVGVHFFNPVSSMMLVEVIRGAKTSNEIFDQALSFVGKIAKLPLPAQSRPGFLVNRVLMPYLLEAMYLLEEGVSADKIDQAATRYGMPMGPIRLADQVGLDVCLSVGENLVSHFGGNVPGKLKQMVDQGKLGCKSGHGFYNYKNGKKIKSKVKHAGHAPADLTDRLIMRMLNECMACLREGVVSDADLCDAGMIFGTGFAPFRGGPIYYIRQQGVSQVIDTLKNLQQNHGDRFTPDQGWLEAEKYVTAVSETDQTQVNTTQNRFNNNGTEVAENIG